MRLKCLLNDFFDGEVTSVTAGDVHEWQLEVFVKHDQSYES